MDKIHLKVTLDIYAVCYPESEPAERLAGCLFAVDPECKGPGEEVEIQDITVEDVVVTDSR